VAETPADVALISAVPSETPRAMPSSPTMIATALSDDENVMTASLISSPLASKAKAVKRNSPPAGTIASAGLTSTRAALGGAPEFVSVMNALLALTPVGRDDDGGRARASRPRGQHDVQLIESRQVCGREHAFDPRPSTPRSVTLSVRAPLRPVQKMTRRVGSPAASVMSKGRA
jgi:hypothetical protein